MANRYLITLSGDIAWDNTANWSATAGGAGGASFPVTGDTAYLLAGTARITSGLNQSAQAPHLVVGFFGSIGTESASFQIGAGVITCNEGSTATIYIASAAAAELQMFSGTQATVKITSGSSWTIATAGGFLSIGASCTGSSLNTWQNAQVNATASTTTGSSWTGITMGGGFVSWGQPLDNAGLVISMYGGTFVNFAPPTASVTSIATFYIFTASATYYHNTPQTLTTLAVSDGLATASGAIYPFTVFNSNVVASGQIFPNPPVTITYTNPTQKSLRN